MSKGRTLHTILESPTKSRRKSHFKHITAYCGYEFADLIDWRTDDYCGNSNGRKSRRNYRIKLRRKVKRVEERKWKNDLNYD